MGTNPSGLHHPVSVYAKQVTQGKLRDMCCEFEILACQRHLDDLKRIGDPDFPYVFDTTRADRVIRWFKKCIQVRGPFAGQPIEPQPWQVFDQSCLLGWVHKDTGARRFTRSYNKRARGNVKSTENSAKCLYFLLGDAMYPPFHPEKAVYESEPEVECAAVDREQAKRVFGDAKKIAAASPEIAKRLVIPRSNPVTTKARGGFMRALSKETKNKDSGAPCYVCIDEYHAHPTSEIHDVLLNSFGKRAQSLMDVITTAGDDAEAKPCFKEEQYAKQILRGEVTDDRYFVMIRELPEGADVHDRSEWLKPNPVLRYPNAYAETLRQAIEDEYTEAYGSKDPDKIRAFLTRRMCQWQAASVNSYLDERCLQLAREAQVSPEEFAALTDGLECWCGFDLGKRIDLSGVGAVFLLPDGRVAIRAYGFMPENAAARHEKTDRMPYLSWAKEGYVGLTPGDVTDNSYVHSWICENERAHHWKIVEVDYDGANAVDLAIQMNEERNREDFTIEISQTCAGQNMAVKGFRELLLQGKIVIERSPLTIRCLANAVEITNNYGDIKLSKRHKDDTQRIDPVAAVMNALARALVRKNTRTLADVIREGKFSM